MSRDARQISRYLVGYILLMMVAFSVSTLPGAKSKEHFLLVFFSSASWLALHWYVVDYIDVKENIKFLNHGLRREIFIKLRVPYNFLLNLIDRPIVLVFTGMFISLNDHRSALAVFIIGNGIALVCKRLIIVREERFVLSEEKNRNDEFLQAL